ncbi:tRNA (adenosine(37)-N6)-threonylcarbamoyltransferase complex ATPase subunit type 1 TsaE [Nocardiopsis ansamitocini]|uniref:tRNA threonylcarbamoyladenosine biosynthesis protein TsaE n=1 Tax=Nocardiopsis ansamitocini TaxID=1670832 RepID=A0A9W6P8X6_9ACTN|nr:tRNA (adenosine(37)-N6)-threonylcarbamoyltransferase complex ATPase subunit type 1 TsaE [Nocardiopsis ansamitocini]GLU49335.1 tRNA threonylcarbamoyladenosine biosynthesis protein TsaE [Nocardiopsis ansamitocini]
MTRTQPTTPTATVTRIAATDTAMRGLGAVVGRQARAGDLLILSGPLGAGKTTFTQGLGQGMSVRGPVTSPTFAIARTHPSLVQGPALVHADAYRLAAAEEMEDLDLDLSLPESVTVIEWGEGLAEGLSDERLEVAIDRLADDTRTVRFTAVGARWVDALAGLGTDELE